MAVRRTRGNSKYNTTFFGGTTMLGDNGVMYVNRQRHQRGLHDSAVICCPKNEYHAKLTGPGQRISQIPDGVFLGLVTCLSKPSPLHDDWRMVGDKALKLSQEGIDSIAYQYSRGPMEGVLRKMIERKMTIGQLVTILCEIRRLDAVTILTDAGYPRDIVPAGSTKDKRKDVHEYLTDDGHPVSRTFPDVEQDCQEKSPEHNTLSSVHRETDV